MLSVLPAMMLLAEMFPHGQPWGLVEIAVAIVIVLAVCAIVYVFCQAAGVTIPPWLIRVLLIVIAAVVCIAAIRFVATM